MVAWYNEIDKKKAAWLRELIKAGLISPGVVDERSIKDVKADELREYTQCHFFAGIGGWSYALRLAGWPDARPVWTGSCPCQPFSAAGQQKAQSDERHLWPDWFGIIREYRPTVVFGEQVERAVAHGWLDDAFHDLEAEGYACAPIVLPALCVGNPHKRDRIWFVGDSQYNGFPAATITGGNGSAVQYCEEGQDSASEFAGTGEICALADSTGVGQPGQGQVAEPMYPAARDNGQANQPEYVGAGLKWLECPDGRIRIIESGVPVLADGLSKDIRELSAHGFGDAIVSKVAAEFIKAYMEIS